MLFSSSTQFFFFLFSLLFSPCTMMRLVTSVCPFVWGWATDVNLSLMPNSEQKALNLSLSNYFPLSVIKVWGMPNLHMTSFQKKCWIRASVMVGTASTSTHFMKWSTATIRNFFWDVETGNGHRISIPHIAKGHGLPIGCWMLEGWCEIRVNCWHLVHLWTSWKASFAILGQ